MVENNTTNTTKKPCNNLNFDLTLTLSSDHDHGVNKRKHACVGGDGDHHGGLYRQDSVSGGGSSFSIARVTVKREREVKSQESERVISATSVEEDDDGIINSRKKLRLTKAQSALLEQAFKHHSTLNPVCCCFGYDHKSLAYTICSLNGSFV
ncbi:HD-ZIP protein [Artemisia annua]|uniref:HD-ZIP protein n=1 Tax=Artemisia annua TaxID=35608 RepID=A0A2U1N0Q7_ARTAN|nr:HD-ZIP protein [Artemisia annua]